MESGVYNVGCRAVLMDEIDTEEMILEGVLSSESIDWHGTIFSAEATQRALDKYGGSVSAMHPRDGGVLPVGKIVKREYTNDGKARIEVKLSKTDRAYETWQLAKDNVLQGFSIQFARAKSEINEEGTPVITDYDIIDVTIHTNPSNPDAVIDGLRSKGLFDKFLVWLKGERNNSGEEPLKQVEGKVSDNGSGDRAIALEKERDEFEDEAKGWRSKYEKTNTKLEVLEKEKYEEGLRSLGTFDPADIDILTKHREYLEEHKDLNDFIRSMAEARPDTASTKTKTDTTPGEADYDDENEADRVKKGVAEVVDVYKDRKVK